MDSCTKKEGGTASQRLKPSGAVICALERNVGQVPALIPASPVSGAAAPSASASVLSVAMKVTTHVARCDKAERTRFQCDAFFKYYLQELS